MIFYIWVIISKKQGSDFNFSDDTGILQFPMNRCDYYNERMARRAASLDWERLSADVRADPSSARMTFLDASGPHGDDVYVARASDALCR